MADQPLASATQGRRAVWSWAIYDWANSAFVTAVVAGFFPILFHDYWNPNVDPALVTARLSLANALASLLVAVSAPVLGAIADRVGGKRRFLGVFMLIGVAATAGLSFTEAGAWLPALVLYVTAYIGLMGANIFYDALLVAVAREERWHFVSGLGFGLGYLGGGLLFAGSVFISLNPAAFGFADAASAAKFTFLLVAGWWLLFALPLFLFVREPRTRAPLSLSAALDGFRRVGATLRRIRKFKWVVLFLLAYWVYIDAVDTVIVLAVSYGKSLGFASKDLILALLLVQFVGFPAAIAYGKLGERWGAKRGILLGLAVYIVICVWGALVTRPEEFYLIAVLIGLVQGGVQALSRSFYARLIPPEEAGEFFGFYNLLGKSATLIGPPLFGWFGLMFGNPRYSMVALILLFIIGAVLLMRVPEPERVSA